MQWPQVSKSDYTFTQFFYFFEGFQQNVFVFIFHEIFLPVKIKITPDILLILSDFYMPCKSQAIFCMLGTTFGV